MEYHVGLDVSLRETSICVVDGEGHILCEGTVISEPKAIAAFIKTNAVNAKRIGRRCCRNRGEVQFFPVSDVHATLTEMGLARFIIRLRTLMPIATSTGCASS